MIFDRSSLRGRNDAASGPVRNNRPQVAAARESAPRRLARAPVAASPARLRLSPQAVDAALASGLGR